MFLDGLFGQNKPEKENSNFLTLKNYKNEAFSDTISIFYTHCKILGRYHNKWLSYSLLIKQVFFSEKMHSKREMLNYRNEWSQKTFFAVEKVR